MILAAYLLVVESTCWGSTSRAEAVLGGLVAALLVVVHSFQLEPNRTARMYGLGALLAVLSAWILLRAIRCRKRTYAWWIVYGATTALFLLTHHFAIFTLAAQGAFALWCACAPQAVVTVHHSPRTGSAIDQPTARRGILLASIFTLALYSPWLPAGITQTTRVSEDFWVAERTALEWSQTFVRWYIGIDWADTTLIVICLAAAALIAVRTLVGSAYRAEFDPKGPAWQAGPTCRNPAAIALLAQAVLPWAAIALISTVGNRPMLQDRYLAFSQASWLALLGVVVASVSRPEWRAGVAVLLIGATLLGTQQFVTALPSGSPGISAATERLARDYRQGGVIVVQEAPDVNCLKFYLSQVSEMQFDVRAWRRPWPATGHINHVASLESSEFLSRIEDFPANVPQLWFAGSRDDIRGGSNQPGWDWKDEVTYEGHGPQAPDYILRRYERPAKGPEGRQEIAPTVRSGNTQQ
jgi:hypothetical protein